MYVLLCLPPPDIFSRNDRINGMRGNKRALSQKKTLPKKREQASESMGLGPWGPRKRDRRAFCRKMEKIESAKNHGWKNKKENKNKLHPSRRALLSLVFG